MKIKKMIWEKENWIPGVVCKEQLRKLIKNGFLKDTNPEFDGASDHSSLDLHLTAEAFKMKGSIKPCGGEYSVFYQNKKLAEPLRPNRKGEFELFRNQTYIFKILENFSPLVKESNIYAQATAKSSIGRVDVVARLIVDGMHVYEYMEPKGVSSGNMFLEITPITFNVKVKAGISLSQIRFFVDNPSKSIISSESISKTVLRGGIHNDGTLSIDLSNEVVGGLKVAAFSGWGVKDGNKEFVPLWGKETLQPYSFWKCIPSDFIEGKARLTIEPDKFYILRSKERIALPKGVAVYCQAMDETLGEMRIHYAGFAHPFFGMNRADEKDGTPLIFEVRGHNVKVNLTHGEKLAKLVFYRMSEDCKLNKEHVSEKYNNQELQLSKLFKPWPENLVSTKDFKVRPVKVK
jgi:dCTP deaminase